MLNSSRAKKLSDESVKQTTWCQMAKWSSVPSFYCGLRETDCYFWVLVKFTFWSNLHKMKATRHGCSIALFALVQEAEMGCVNQSHLNESFVIDFFENNEKHFWWWNLLLWTMNNFGLNITQHNKKLLSAVPLALKRKQDFKMIFKIF